MEKLRKDPYTLPPGYHWDTLNLDDPLVVSDCITLQLNSSYLWSKGAEETKTYYYYMVTLVVEYLGLLTWIWGVPPAGGSLL